MKKLIFQKHELIIKVHSTIEVIGYGWYRDFYCAQVKINTHSFDINLNQISRINKYKNCC